MQSKTILIAGAEIFETDNFWINADGKYVFNPELLSKAHDWNQKNTLNFCKSNPDKVAIVSNTLCGINDISPYVEIAKSFGRPVFIITCSGKFKNIHNVPDNTIERMRMKFVQPTILKNLLKNFNVNVFMYNHTPQTTRELLNQIEIDINSLKSIHD